MLYKISHRTTYRYVYPVSVGEHVACLQPRSFAGNLLRHNSLAIHPTPSTQTERTDYFGNRLCFFTVQEPHKELVVESSSEVAVTSPAGTIPAVTIPAGHNPAVTSPAGNSPSPLAPAAAVSAYSPPWEESARALAHDHSREALEAYQFQFESPRIRLRPEFAAYALQSFTPGRPMREALRELTARIYRDFRFDSRVTTVRTPTEEVFLKRHGVCQDFAHVQIACLRSINLAARYVSGYLRTYPPPGRPRLVGADASHAWASAYCRGLGWLDMDPTNNVAPTEDHVTLAWGRDYGDVSPLRGLILGGGSHTLKVEVDMEPIGP